MTPQPPPDASSAASRVLSVERRIDDACRRSGRARDSVTLVAVSKTRTADEVLPILHTGLCHLGENRPEEAAEKIPLVDEYAAQGGLPAPIWHMIGHVQSRKTTLVVGPYALVHSLDSLHLGQRLSRLAVASGCTLDCLVQVNVSGEESKSGYVVSDPAGELPPPFLSDLSSLLALPGIRLRGLMTIPPAGDDPEDARPYFRRLRLLRERLAGVYPAGDWRELSMGMTDDFEVAIEEGATLVRVGRAIFGPRTA